MKTLDNYPFIENDRLHRLKSYFREFGIKAVYKQFRRKINRNWSRNIIRTFAPEGPGLETGVGARTIAPVDRTVLSDAFDSHGACNHSIAGVFFKAHEIPYADGSFSFILSEHVLEHIANPIKTLRHWMTKLQQDGVIILFLPHKQRTFDHMRPSTSLAHLIEDYEKDVPDNDLTHIDEFGELVISKGLCTQYENIQKDKLAETGNIHHHVWVTGDIVELLEYLGLEVLFVEDKVPDRVDSFVVVAKK